MVPVLACKGALSALLTTKCIEYSTILVQSEVILRTRRNILLDLMSSSTLAQFYSLYLHNNREYIDACALIMVLKTYKREIWTWGARTTPCSVKKIQWKF